MPAIFASRGRFDMERAFGTGCAKVSPTAGKFGLGAVCAPALRRAWRGAEARGGRARRGQRSAAAEGSAAGPNECSSAPAWWFRIPGKTPARQAAATGSSGCAAREASRRSLRTRVKTSATDFGGSAKRFDVRREFWLCTQSRANPSLGAGRRIPC